MHIGGGDFYVILQGRLWPLRIVDVYPHNAGTARLRLRGVGDDGMPYFIKAADPGSVPANELLGSALASAVGLAVPTFAIALMPVDRDQPEGAEPAEEQQAEDQVFASRQEAGLADSQAWFDNLVQNHCPPNVARQLAGWFAFDLFINNPDRHIYNYLCRDVDGVLTVHGFDFSEALLEQDWPPSQRMSPGCHTIRNRTALTQLGIPFEPAQAIEVLDRIAAMPDSWMSDALAEVPTAWLTDDQRTSLDSWWREERAARVELIKQDISDGAYN